MQTETNNDQPMLNSNFMLKTTQHINELSPLIKNTESVTSSRLRIPIIFGEKKSPKEHNKFDELMTTEEAEKLESL